jgi:hypothetical protein
LPDSDQNAIADYVRAASRQIGLAIPREYEPEVLQDFTRLAGVAEFLMQIPLDQNIEPGPVFEP